jgi:nucleoside-diphosphate-sugar epimerase
MSNKFIITGGAGFIGSNLAEALSRENEVVVIDDFSYGKVENLSGMDVQLIKGASWTRNSLAMLSRTQIAYFTWQR